MDGRIDKLNQDFYCIIAHSKVEVFGTIFRFQQNTYNPVALQDVGNWIKLQDLQTALSAVLTLTLCL